MAQQKRVETNINIENARIGFRNFSGKEGQYNPQGNRNFVVFLDDIPLAKNLEEEGWNIRWLTPREDDEQEQPILPVKVAFGAYPPKIMLVNTNGVATRLKEEDLNILDWADIKKVDLTIRPYNYDVRGKTGVKAYLKVAYITIQADPWESKYEFANSPDSAQNIVCESGYELIDGVCRLVREED
jgi:hypothetical protein